VEPKIFLLADIGQRVEVVNCSGVGRPRGANDAEWQKAILPILRDSRFQRLQVNLEEVVDWHKAERIATQAQQFHSLLD
jgi:hypothetical protein